MTEPKYKAGDKVMSRGFRPMQEDDCCFPAAKFKKFYGEVLTIVKSKEDLVEEGQYAYLVKEAGSDVWWPENYFEGYAFEWGEEIEVSYGGKDWAAGFRYASYVDLGKESIYLVSNPAGLPYLFEYARPIQKKETITEVLKVWPRKEIILDGYKYRLGEENENERHA